MTLQIVKAGISHSRDIWEWRNDPVSRSLSRQTERVEWNEHKSWYQKYLDNKKSYLYIGIKNETSHNIPIGVIRFDLMDFNQKYYEVSINIAPNSRGKGYGSLLLKRGTKKFIKDVDKCIRLYAEIKVDNLLSIGLFTSAGYSPFESNNKGFLKFFNEL